MSLNDSITDWRDEPDFGDPMADPPIPPGQFTATDIQPGARTESTPRLYDPISAAERARVACEKRVAGAWIAAKATGDLEAAAEFRRLLDRSPWQYDPHTWTYPGTEHGARFMDLALRGKIGDLVRARSRDLLGPTEPLDPVATAERKEALRR